MKLRKYLAAWTALVAVACIILPALSGTVALAQDNTLTALDIARMQGVTSAAISPDGTHVAYTVSVPRDPMKEDNGSAYTELHLADTDGNTRGFITGKVSIRSVRWAADGKSLTFLTKRGDDKHTSLYRIPVDGGEAHRIVAHDTSISEYWFSPDGAHVAFLAKEEEPKKVKKWSDKGFDAIVYEENHKFTRVWIAKTDAGEDDEPRLLDAVQGNASGLSWSPAGSHLVVALAPTPLVDDGYMRKKVNLIDVESGKVTATINNTGKLGKVRFSPDGKHLAMMSAADKHDTSNGRLMVVPAQGGTPSDILPNYTDKDVRDFAWQTDDTIMFLASEGVWNFFAEVNIDGRAHKIIIPTGGPIMTAMSLNGAGTAAAFVANSPKHPGEVYTMSHGDQGPRRITNSNPWLDDKRLAEQEVVTYTAGDGLEIEGILFRPIGEQKGKRYPMILTVHGGPEAHYSNGWLTRYSGAGHLGAAEGYAVFYPNYRGSTGRGVAFAKTSQADAAGKEFDDLADGVQHMIDSGLVDKDRVGITGGSYGGYASAWGATAHSHLYAASVMFVGISNNISKTGTTDIPIEMNEVHHLKWLWDDWNYFLERSPIYHVEKAKTPLLIMHGKDDPRVHPSQSMELYRHVKVRGETPVRLVFFPGEGHGNRKAAGRLDYTLRMMRWFDHYLKGDGDRRKKPAPPATIDYESEVGEISD